MQLYHQRGACRRVCAPPPVFTGSITITAKRVVLSQAYQNPWTAALDAKAILGDQIEAGMAIDWHSAEYVGSALTDAFVALALSTDDWNEKGLLWFDSHRHFLSWALGHYQWPPVQREEAYHPQLGCNNDRMTHTPKGIGVLKVFLFRI